MESMQDAVSANAVARLKGSLRGAVIGPSDADYDEARAVYVSGFDRRPAVLVRPADAVEVSRVVNFARESGLPLAVRSGGHSLAGHSAAERGVVLDLSALRGLEVDVAGRSAWAQTGLTAGDYTHSVGAHGLATGFGDAPTVGIGGITLGGGIGFLHRRHGLTIDNLLEAEVVTADGRVLRAGEDENADLFWAIRGGGGNFGIATRFRFRLAEVNTVVGGLLILPATPAIVAAFLAEAQSAPGGLAGMINVTMAPPMPFLPPEVHGTPIIMGLMVYDGDAESGARAFAPFRSLATPIVDTVAPIAYPAMFEGAHPPHPDAMVVRSFFMDSFDLADAELALDALQRSTAPMRVAQFRVMGGAVARVPADATAFAHRSRRIMGTAAAALFGPGVVTAPHESWADGLAGALHHGEPGAYVGFMCNEAPDRVRAAYHGATWDRLRTIKAKYDPDNLFSLNQNIPPAE